MTCTWFGADFLSYALPELLVFVSVFNLNIHYGTAFVEPLDHYSPVHGSFPRRKAIIIDPGRRLRDWTGTLLHPFARPGRERRIPALRPNS